DPEGELLILSWGSTYGAAITAVQKLREQGAAISHAHLRYLNPFPKNLGDILQRFNKVLIPELNLGQLRLLIRARYLVDAVGLSKVQRLPFLLASICVAPHARPWHRHCHRAQSQSAGSDGMGDHG